jgi:hypothetical protein
MALRHNDRVKRIPCLLLLVIALACSSSAAVAPAPAKKPTARSTTPGKYIVMIEGRNLIFASNGKPKRYGFSTTRDVKARSPEEAEQLAIRSVREDAELNRALLNDPSDPPRIVVTQKVRVESFELHRRPDSPYIFFADRDTR